MSYTKIANNLSESSLELAETFTSLYYRDVKSFSPPEGYRMISHRNGSSNRGRSKGEDNRRIGSDDGKTRVIAYVKYVFNNSGKGRGYNRVSFLLLEEI